MRQKLFLALVAFASNLTTSLYAGNEITLYDNNHHDRNIPHRYEIPKVTHDDDIVTISSDSLISDMRVIIKDTHGNVMYDNRITINPSDNTIYVPEEYDSEKYSIELIYDKRRLYGYFEK